MSQLTPKQARFVDEYLLDSNGTQAALRAGYSPRTACEQASRLLRNVQVRELVERKMRDSTRDLEIRREDCLRGLVEAFELAREQGNPGAMVGAVRELNKMCGFHEPERVQVNLSDRNEKLVRQLEVMPTAELIRLVEGGE